MQTFDTIIQEILSTPPKHIDWGTKMIGADEAWKKYRGRGIRVGIIDSGIDYNHPDLKPNVKECKSFIDYGDGFDSNFHGTHVTGIIAAKGVGVKGVAPDVEIYSAKIFNSHGKTNTQAQYDAFKWMIEKKVNVVNMSFGGMFPADFPGVSEFLKEYHTRIKEMHDAGIIMVAATGNSGNLNDVMDRISHPARFPEVFAVGAICQEMQRAHFTSVGKGLDFSMPGVDVYSCYPNHQWARFSGTSMASPYLAGCVALLQEYAISTFGRPFSYQEIKNELVKHAIDLGVEGVDAEFGYGMINIGKIGVAMSKKVEVNIDQPMIYDEKTWRVLAPLRFITEINGGQILDWDKDTRTVIFKTPQGKKVTMQVDNPKVIVEDV